MDDNALKYLQSELGESIDDIDRLGQYGEPEGNF